MNRARLIYDTIGDLVSDLTYYNRKEDDELPSDAIEDAIRCGETSVEAMTEYFREALLNALKL